MDYISKFCKENKKKKNENLENIYFELIFKVKFNI